MSIASLTMAFRLFGRISLLRQSAMLNIRMRGDAGARKSARRNAKAAQPRGFQQCILPAEL